MKLNSILREHNSFIYSPPETIGCFDDELFPFEENCSQIFSDFFLKLLLKLLDLDLTISDKTIMLISVCFFPVFIKVFLYTLLVSLNKSILELLYWAFIFRERTYPDQ